MSDDAMGGDKAKQSKGAESYSRRRFIKIAALAGAAIPAGSALLAACGDAVTATPAATTANLTTTAAAATNATTAATTTTTGATTTAATTTSAATTAATTTSATTTAATATGNIVKSSVANVADVYLAPLPPFKSVLSIPGRGSSVKAFSVAFGPAPLPKDQNKFWQELDKRLGVNYDLTLAAGNQAYSEKANVLIASGDLPDLFFIDFGNAPSLLQTIQQGAFTDLTPYLGGDAVKAFPNLATFAPIIWKNSAIKGKIFGVPRPRGLTGQTLSYRKDWADKLGLAEPKNSDELIKWLDAMTNKDPDGDGQQNTWGMGFPGTSPNNLGLAQHQFFMNLFRVPNQWRLESDGSLTNFVETPEFKQAIDFETKVYKAGLFYPDSLTSNPQQMVDNFKAGKYASFATGFTYYSWAQQEDLRKVNPKMVLAEMMPFGADGGKGNHWLGGGYFGFTAIPAKVGKDPERVKELLQVLDYFAAPQFSEENDFLNYGLEGIDYDIQPNGTKKRNANGDKEVTYLASLTNGVGPIFVAQDPPFGLGIQKYQEQLLSVGITNPVAALTSPTAGKQKATLDQLMDDRVLRIVKGNDPLAALDDAVKEWRSRGGDTIRKEYVEALKG